LSTRRSSEIVSTLLELAGFACWVLAASVWQTYRLECVTGLLALGLALLVVGYSFDDAAATVAVKRVIAPVRARVALVRTARRVSRDSAPGKPA